MSEPVPQTGPVHQSEFRWDLGHMALAAMLAGLSLVSGMISRGVGGVLSPFIQEAFDLSYVQVGMVAGSFSLAGAVLSVPLGIAADYIGVRRSLLLTQALMTVGLLIVLAAPSFLVLISGLLIVGTGRTLLQPGANRVVLQEFPRQLLATVMGTKQMGVSAGGGVAALALPWLAVRGGWQAAVGLLAAAAALLGVVVYRFYQPSVQVAVPGRHPMRGQVLEALRDPRLRAFVVICVLGVGSQMAMEAHLMLYLVTRMQVTPVLAGFVVFASGLAAAFGRVIWGVLADRFWPHDRRRPLLIVFAVGCLCSLLLALAGPSWTLLLVAVIASLFGMSLLGWNTLQMTIAAELGGPQRAGVTTGVALTAGAVGGMLGAPLFGLVVDHTGTYATAWLLAAAVLALAMLQTARLRLG